MFFLLKIQKNLKILEWATLNLMEKYAPVKWKHDDQIYPIRTISFRYDAYDK